ncbi:MAG: hypothetical protein IJ600_00790 [Lachnospiraceae bacterium]|nr:hypothetical protein [Lachnospiraceae bacterium]
MRTFAELSPSAQEYINAFLFLASLVASGSLLYGREQGNVSKRQLGSLLIFLAVFIPQPLLGAYTSGKQLHLLHRLIGQIPAAVLLAGGITAVLFSVAEVCYVIRQRRNALGRHSVKEAFDYLPDGVAYFRRNGAVRLVNHQMQHLFRDMTGMELQSYKELQMALEEQLENGLYTDGDGEIWRYRESEAGGPGDTEAVFMNVTGFCRLEQELQGQMEELKKVSADLKKLSENALQLTREKEILAARMQVHDRLGAGLLAMRYRLSKGSADAEGHERAFAEEEESIRRMQEALESIGGLSEQTGAARPDLEELTRDAASLGVVFVMHAGMPRDAEISALFAAAARECLTNCVRHSDATSLEVFPEESDAGYRITIRNNGTVGEDEITPKGGLLNLQRKAAEFGGGMQVRTDGGFCVVLEIPRRQGKEECG